MKTLGPLLPSLVSLNLSNTKLNNQSINDFTSIFHKSEMSLTELDLHSNQITAEGFSKLIVCLKTNNKVRALNISKNSVSNDLKQFRMVQKFLNCNKVLEDLNMSFCNLNEEAGSLIAKGLRGNRNLQVLNLKGNPIKSAVSEIARSFLENKKALCLKELDVSKCSLEPAHFSEDFFKMLKSEFTTLKILGLRDNLIKQGVAE